MGPRISSARLVGREDELAFLHGLLGPLKDAGVHVVTVLISGEAGIGKSRLLDEFCAQSRAGGVLVAAGACAPSSGGGLPYAPIVGILRDLVRQLDPDTALRTLRPALEGLGLPVPGRERDGEDHHRSEEHSLAAIDKTRLFAAMLTSISTLADRGPTILVFEDLHWADSASAELFDFLTRNLRHSPILLIGTYRNDELNDQHPLRGPLIELGRHRQVAELQIGGLDRTDTACLLSALLGWQPDEALVESVHRRSEGNPFFVEELTAASSSPRLSEELRNIILLRVQQLSTSAQRLLAVAAVIGIRTEHDLLAAVVQIEGEDIDATLAEVLDHRILVVVPGAGEYRFRHTLLYEAVGGALAPAERARLHGAVASVLVDHPELSAAGPGHAAAEQAGHWWEAGRWPEALEACVEAGEAAATVFAFAEAHAQFERALTAWDHVPDAAVRLRRDRASLYEVAAEAAYLCGDGHRAVDLIRSALAEIDPEADPVRAAVCLTSLGRNAWTIGDSRSSLVALEQALVALPGDSPSVERARILAEKGRALMLLSRNTEAQSCCEFAIETAQAVGARAEEGHALNTLGVVRGSLGHLDEGIALLRKALEIAEELVDPDSLNRGYANLCFLFSLSGRQEDSAAVTLDAMAAGEALGGIRLNAAALNSACALVRLGRWDEASALMLEVDGVSGNCTMERELVEGEIALRRGDFDAASRALVVLEKRTRLLEDVQFRGDFHLLRAALALEEARPRDAFDEVEQALALSAPTEDRLYVPQMCLLGVQALADRAEQDRATGRRSATGVEKLRGQAAGLAQEAETASRPPDPEGDGFPLTRACSVQCRAEESRLHESDPVLWDDAATCWDELGYRYHVAYCRWREAEGLLNRGGQRAGASDSLRASWRIATELGARPLLTRIERLAQRARIELQVESAVSNRNAGAIDLGLTAREGEVLELLASGRTDGQIAEELFISKKTASVHVSNVLRKLGVANRIEAGAIGQDLRQSEPANALLT